MRILLDHYDAITDRLEGVGRWLAPLGLRLILAWEFWEAGREKFSGSNWFMSIQGQFPWPFGGVPTSISWSLATWTELVAAVALALGLFTRFFAFSLFVLTVVATAAVHWPDSWMMFSDLLKGYAISDTGHGNYKLPLLFMVMLLPLILHGGGRLSVDALLKTLRRRGDAEPNADALAWSLAMLALGLPIAMLLPTLGLAVAGAGVLLAVSSRWLRG
jgi:putative oxidoreductase